MPCRRRKTAVVALLLMAAAAIAFWFAGRLDNSGIDARRWVASACASSRRIYPVEARAVGTNAVPFLIDNLKVRDTWLRRLGEALGMHLPPSLQKHWPKSPSVEDLHNRAADILKSFGPDAKPALPELIDCLQNENPIPALDAIGNIGPGAKKAVPALRSALANTNWFFKIKAASVLWKVGRETNEVLGVYKAALMQTNEFDPPLMAVLDAQEMDEASRAVLGAILTDHILHTADPNNRDTAVSRFITLNDRSDAAKRALLAGAKDPNPGIRRDCSLTLWSQWPDDPACAALGVHAFLEWKSSPQPSPISLLQRAKVTRIDPATTIPALKEDLHDDDPKIRDQAAQALKDVESFESSKKRNQP